MVSARRIAGMLGSVGLHVAVLASVVDARAPALPEPPPFDELVAVAVVATEPTSLAPRELGPEVQDAPAPEPSGEIEDPSRAPDPSPPATEAEAREPPPSATSSEHPPSEPTSPAVEPEPPMPGADALPIAPGADDQPDVDPASVPARPERNADGAGVVDARGTGASDAGGGGTYDASAYGNEIVRLVLDELDLDPVPGLKRSDSIRVVLRVKPDGSLAWPASGRYGFALVLGSSVGPIRTRAFLKRIERASARFPPHPTGLKKRRYYEMELTFKFTRALAHG